MHPETITFQIAGFLLAPLMLGVINKTKAWFAGRNGAPYLQPYYDLWKLLQKGAVYSSTTTWVFRAGPILALSAGAAAMLLAPIGKAEAPLTFVGDLVLFAGLLGVMRFATIVAALDTGSAFEGMGASREAMLSAIAEPAFYLALAALVLVTGDLTLTGMIGGGSADGWTGATAPALVLVLGAIFLIMLAENSRIPIDDPNTHLELTMVHEVMVLDHGGPDLAYILYGAALKLWLFGTFLVGIAMPFHTGSVWGDGLVFLAGMMVVAFLVGLTESSMARLRMWQTPHLLVTAGVLGGVAIALTLGVR